MAVGKKILKELKEKDHFKNQKNFLSPERANFLQNSYLFYFYFGSVRYCTDFYAKVRP